MSALRLKACKAEFHLTWRRGQSITDPAYASKLTAAELQKEIHSLVQGLSVVKMYFLSPNLRKGLPLADPRQCLLLKPASVVRSG